MAAQAVNMMTIQPIRTQSDHERAMTRLTACLESDPEPGTSAADEAEVLATLIAHYESAQFPVERPSPIDAILFRMDQLDLAQKELVPYIGSASKVSEILNGKRTLSLPMIRRLRDGLGIPADVLIGSSDGSTASSAAKQLARLGGTQTQVAPIPRRRSTPV
jgi:HTH-type transcriptional regulator/antitoxin HigA